MSSIWHTKKEKPIEDKTIFAQHKSFRDGSIECFIWEKQEFTDAIRNDVIAWCYLDDLLALETKLIRTRKALDKGMEHITGLNNMIESWLNLINSDLDQETKLHILKSAISAYVENKGGDNE